jgi:hypothetical protein
MPPLKFNLTAKRKMKTQHVIALALIMALNLGHSDADANWQYPHKNWKGTGDDNSTYGASIGAPTERWAVNVENGTLRLGDVTGDGKIDIVVLANDGLHIYDADGNQQGSTISTHYGASYLILEDVDNDNSFEMIVGTAWNRNNPHINTYKANGTLYKTFSRNMGSDVGMYAVAYLGSNRLLVGYDAGYSRDPRGCAILDLSTNPPTEVWYYDVGPRGGTSSIADLNNDGLQEFVASSYTSHNGATGCGYNNNGTCTTDGDLYTIVVNENGDEVFTQALSSNGERNGSGNHKFYDLNGDGQVEIVAFIGHDPRYYQGNTQIKVLDQNGTELHMVSVGQNVGHGNPLIADLDNDGDKEIISSASNRFLIHDHTLNLIAEDSDYYPRFASDIDGDNSKEIIVSEGQNLHALSLNNNTLIKEWTIAFEGDVRASVVTNLDNDSQAELVVATKDGKLHLLDLEPSENQLQFSSATYNVAENEGQATISVTRTGSNGAISVDYTTSDDSATAPDDYTQTSGTLNWNDGDDADKTFPINITDDSTPENNEALIVSLGNPTGGAELGSPDTAIVTITDNDTGTVVISVEPPETNIYIGQEFDINILVKAGTQQIDGASAYLDFEPTYLEIVSMTPADHLDQIIENSFDNAAGTINFAAGKLSTPYPSGDFELVTITLRAKAETSETTLNFVFNPPRQTNATFGGTLVFDHAENGIVHINPGALIKGSVELQGRAPKPDISWETEVRINLTEPSYSFTTTTDQNGEFEIGPIDPSSYDMRIKGTHTLQKNVSVTLKSGENFVPVGTLFEGDADDDNCVGILDFSILASTFGKCESDSGFDARADFNQNACVMIQDFSLLAANFGQCGAPNPSTMVLHSALTTGFRGKSFRAAKTLASETVVMSIATTQVNIGETFEVAVKVQAGEQRVDGASAYLEFETTDLEVINMSTGGYLDLTLENSYDNGAGTINFAAGKLTAPFPSGDFELVTIRLRAKTGVPSSIVFKPGTDATFGGASVFDHGSIH